MNTPTLTVDLDRAGRHLTVYVAGALDAATAPTLTSEVLGHIHDDDQVVWLDLAAVTFCDSSGTSALARLHEHIKDAGGRLTLYNPAPPVLHVLELCGLDKVVSIWTQPGASSPEPVVARDR